MKELIKKEGVAGKIHLLRGVQVMLDRDLAELYETETRTLKQAVKRNSERFPADFMFELTDTEIGHLVSQSVIPSKKLHTEQKVDAVLDAISAQELDPKQGVFFDGQIFDAYSFVSKLVRKAKRSIVLIDNYVDDSVLTLLSKRRKNVTARVYCKRISKQLQLDLEKHNAQYPQVEIVPFDAAHDRFLILDDTLVYHVGASLKDLGKKWFAFSKIEKDALKVIEQLKRTGI